MIVLENIQSLDWSILYWIQNNLKCDFLDVLMPLFSHLGSLGIIWILIAFSFISKKKYRLCGVCMLVGMIIGVLIGNFTIKLIIARPRPCWLDETIPLLVKNPTDYSFPSGHTLASTISAIIISINHKRHSLWALPLAFIIAFSRLYNFVHFPSDILGGAILGVIIAIIVEKCFKSKINNFISKTELKKS